MGRVYNVCYIIIGGLSGISIVDMLTSIAYCNFLYYIEACSVIIQSAWVHYARCSRANNFTLQICEPINSSAICLPAHLALALSPPPRCGRMHKLSWQLCGITVSASYDSCFLFTLYAYYKHNSMYYIYDNRFRTY